MSPKPTTYSQQFTEKSNNKGSNWVLSAPSNPPRCLNIGSLAISHFLLAISATSGSWQRTKPWWLLLIMKIFDSTIRLSCDVRFVTCALLWRPGRNAGGSDVRMGLRTRGFRQSRRRWPKARSSEKFFMPVNTVYSTRRHLLSTERLICLSNSQFSGGYRWWPAPTSHPAIQ